MMAALMLLVMACRSPLVSLPPTPGGPALCFLPTVVEDHSRSLKRLRRVQPGESNTPEARKDALAEHGRWLTATLVEEAALCGIRSAQDAPYRLEIRVTDLGEVQTKYILIGIASGVGWGVGTGLAAHNARLAVGLGTYELLEESAFWILGGSLFSSFSAPVMADVSLTSKDGGAPIWKETYYALSGRKWTKTLDKEARSDRGVQLRGSMQTLILEILEDLEKIPAFPKGTRLALTGPAAGIRPEERVLGSARTH
jgi:hypothetical protein